MFSLYKIIDHIAFRPRFVCRRLESSSLLMFVPVFAHVSPLVVHSSLDYPRCPLRYRASFLIIFMPSHVRRRVQPAKRRELIYPLAQTQSYGPRRWQPGIYCISSRSQTCRQRIIDHGNYCLGTEGQIFERSHSGPWPS
jgi:hypothetical protein